MPGVPAGGGGGPKERNTAGVLAILLGWTGAHKFYLGRPAPGIILAAVFWVSACCGFVLILPWVLSLACVVIGVVEGAIILGKSDAQFQAEYVHHRRDWF